MPLILTVSDIIIFVNRQKQTILFLESLLVILTITGVVACTSSTTSSITVIPVTTSESQLNDGFSFSVAVSNTQIKLGDNIIITTDLQNVSNEHLPQAAIMDGRTEILIRNAAGAVVWGVSEVRMGTSFNEMLSVGYQFTFGGTWKAGFNPEFSYDTIPITTGIYTLSVTDTGFFDPALNTQVPFSVTPIQIVITN